MPLSFGTFPVAYCGRLCFCIADCCNAAASPSWDIVLNRMYYKSCSLFGLVYKTRAALMLFDIPNNVEGKISQVGCVTCAQSN